MDNGGSQYLSLGVLVINPAVKIMEKIFLVAAAAAVFNRTLKGFQKRKIRTAVYPSNMAPIGAKLCQNAFQMIPDISFLDADKHVLAIFFQKKMRKINKQVFWRS